MASQKPPNEEMRSLLERAGVSKGWRLVAAILIVVLIPVWLPLFFMGLGLAVKILKPIHEIAKMEEAWNARRQHREQPSNAPDPEPHSQPRPHGR